MIPASCGHCTALTLGLPAQTVIPAEKGKLPKQLFQGKRSVSIKLKQRFAQDLDSVTVLGLLRSSNTGIADGGRVKEILIIGLVLNCDEVPAELVDYIAQMRGSGIIFVCHRKSCTSDEETGYSFAVRRAVPTKPGYLPQFRVHVGPWKSLNETKLVLCGDDLDALWDNLNAQIILDTTDGSNLDNQIARRAEVAGLVAEEAKLAKDHARAKGADQRNEIYTRLHKVRTKLYKMGALD